MVELSESDMVRMRAFNEQPGYAKRPALLLPDDDEEESTGTETPTEASDTALGNDVPASPSMVRLYDR